MNYLSTPEDQKEWVEAIHCARKILGQSASDESLIGMDTDLTKDEALQFIKKEYRKWNGRLNTLSPGNERDNAQRMLDALARLREKYEKE